MAGKLPRKQEHNKGRSCFTTYEEWYKASRKEKLVGNAIHYTYDSDRIVKGEWTNRDKRLMKRVASNAKAARACDLELVFGSPIPKKNKKNKKPSKNRGKWTGMSEPQRYAA